MAGDNKKTTTSEWATWIPAPQALDLVLGAIAGRSTAIQVLSGRLSAGLIRCAAEHMLADGVRGASPTDLGPDLWLQMGDAVYESVMWEAGDLTLHYARQNKTHVYFGVRFDRQGIGNVLAAAGKGVDTISKLAGPEALSDQPTEKGPPVSEQHLRAWAQLFRGAYPAGSEALASKSAAGMFPGKSVTRSQLRTALDAVGKRPRGRPSDQ